MEKYMLNITKIWFSFPNLLTSCNSYYIQGIKSKSIVYSHEQWKHPSFPGATITWRTAFLCNVTDLNSRIINHTSLPISRKNLLCPNILPIVPGSYHQPELQWSSWNSTCVPYCTIISAHETPIRRTNL